nr:hypothetical protein [Natronococcus sp. CG52]
MIVACRSENLRRDAGGRASRVVTVSSELHERSEIDFDDLPAAIRAVE